MPALTPACRRVSSAPMGAAEGRVDVPSSVGVSGVRTKAQVLIGLLISWSGLALLLSRLDRGSEVRAILSEWWPLLVVAFGLWSLATFAMPRYKPKAPRPPTNVGLAVLAAGLIALGFTLEVLPEPADVLLPVGVMAAGTAVALTGDRYESAIRPWFSETAVACRRRMYSRARGLRQMSARAVAGELTVDLTEATFTGDAELQASVWWGQVWVRLAPRTTAEFRSPAGPRVTYVTVGEANPEATSTLVLSILGAHGRVIVEWLDEQTLSETSN